MKTEAKVGIFVFIGILFLFFLTTQVKEFSTMSKEGYSIFTNMDSVSGLDLNSKVKINGLVGGYVKDMKIDKNRIRVEIFIYKGFKIPKNSTAKLSQESMIGGKNIEIILGASEEFLSDGDILKSEPKKLGFEDASDSIAKAADEFKAFIKEARELLDEKSREDLKKSFANLEKITNELRIFIKAKKFDKTLESISQAGENISTAGIKFGRMSDKFGKTADIINKRLDKIMKQIDSLTKEFSQTGKDINKKLPHLLQKFSDIEDEVKDILKENRKPLNNTLVNASKFFASGDETFNKVENYLDVLSKAKLEVAIRNQRMLNDAYGSSVLSINYLPNPTRYYMLDITGTDDYSRLDENGRFIPPKLHDSGKTYISAQLGKRYNNLLLRAGLIDSRGGVGADYFIYNDKFKASFDLFDWNAENDVRGSSPHARINLRYTFLKHLDAYLGYDNFLNRDADNLFIGVGVRFVDDDLKQLIGSAGLGSFTK